MWTIIKFDKKKFFLLQKDLNKKLGEKCTLYRPQVLIDNLKKRKLVSQEFDLLGDYLFCYNSNFSNKITLDQIKFSVLVAIILVNPAPAFVKPKV